MHYLLYGNGITHNHSVSCANIKQLLPLKISLPAPINGDFPTLEFTSQGKFTLPDYLRFGALHIVSQPLAALLQQFDIPHQCFAVNWQHNGEPQPRYVAHFLGEHAAQDEQQSQLVRDEEGFIDRIEKLVLDEQQLTDVHLTQLAQCWNTIYIVSDAFRQAVKQTQLTGMVFKQPQDCQEYGY